MDRDEQLEALAFAIDRLEREVNDGRLSKERRAAALEAKETLKRMWAALRKGPSAPTQ